MGGFLRRDLTLMDAIPTILSDNSGVVFDKALFVLDCDCSISELEA